VSGPLFAAQPRGGPASPDRLEQVLEQRGVDVGDLDPHAGEPLSPPEQVDAGGAGSRAGQVVVHHHVQDAVLRDGDEHLAVADPERAAAVVVGLVRAGQREHRHECLVELHLDILAAILNRPRAVRVGRSA
jgi:hypothetical protein